MRFKNKKIYFDTSDYFILFMGLIIIGNVLRTKNLFLLIIFIPILFLIILNKTNLINLLIIVGTWTFWILLFVLLTSTLNLKIFSNWISEIFPNFYKYRNMGIKHIEQIYSNKYVSSYINLLVFNHKDKTTYEIYKALNNLSITHLFVVSGLHINSILFLFHKTILFKIKNKRIISLFDFLLCICYSYFLKLSISIMRILLVNLIKLAFKNYDSLKSNYLSAIILLILFKNEVSNYGFMMSYFCVLGILYLNKLINNKLVLTVVVNLYCIVITFPFILKMNGKINIFTFFYNYMFSCWIIFNYFCILLFGFYKQTAFINTYLIIEILKNIQINLELSIFIEFKDNDIFTVPIYTIFTILFAFIEKNNKNNLNNCVS